MNRLALWHNAKSEYAYAYDENTLYITLRTQKDDVTNVDLIFGDPFLWRNKDDKNHMWAHDIAHTFKQYTDGDFDYFVFSIKPEYSRTKYAFVITDILDYYIYGSNGLRTLSSDAFTQNKYDLSEFFNFPYLHKEDLHQTPSWVKETIWYQIFPDRFYNPSRNKNLPWGKIPVNNHELYGGTLIGIKDKLPYLKNLGITGIYFTPIFLAPSAHKYDTTDYFMIDPQFGTNDDFKTLVQSAHALNIKVMLDGVFNHCGFDHPYFQDVIKNGENSLYKDCFYIDEFPLINFPLNEHGRPALRGYQELNYRTFAFTPYMPKWNTAHPLVEKYILDVVSHWITQYDIDGWRLDVSNEISHHFLRKIKQTSRSAKPNTFILGENWDSSYPWLHGDQLDSVMNYDLAFPLWQLLEHRINHQDFIHRVSKYLVMTPKNVMQNMFNLVGSHDTIRIKRRLNDDSRRVRLAYLWMFLSCGAPNIYYGDEMGMTGNHDPDNRRCMLWDEKEQDIGFYLFTKRLIELRRMYKSMSVCDYDFINAPILIFKKSYNDEELLVIMNDNEDKEITIQEKLCGKYIDLINNSKIILCDKIILNAYEFLLLLKEDESHETNHQRCCKKS
ncbi:MAG: glycoside hydrolase family 13 protein [Acholeplasmataceae bacterium]|nr:glycoside hydrolase family 13 protein [Acholeplasmataceae bacterium]